MAVTLEGRIAGPWAEELRSAWRERASSLSGIKVTIDLRNTTYADANGMKVLREVYSQTGAELLTGTPWTKYLAEEVMSGNEQLA